MTNDSRGFARRPRRNGDNIRMTSGRGRSGLRGRICDREDEGASAVEHGLHTGLGEIPAREFCEVAVFEEGDEGLAVRRQGRIGLRGEFVQELVGRAMRGAHRKSLLDEAANDLGYRDGKLARGFRMDERARGFELC